MWLLIDIIVGAALIAQGGIVSRIVGLIAIVLGLAQALDRKGSEPPE
jgi:hypothetical protein